MVVDLGLKFCIAEMKTKVCLLNILSFAIAAILLLSCLSVFLIKFFFSYFDPKQMLRVFVDLMIFICSLFSISIIPFGAICKPLELLKTIFYSFNNDS